MPVVGSSAYNTAGQITAIIRSLLNDSAGNLFTDGLLMPYVNSAYRKVQRALAAAGQETFLVDDVLLVVPAVGAVDPSLQVVLDDSTAPPNQLPTDLLAPLEIWERANLSSSDFVRMTDVTATRRSAGHRTGKRARRVGMARGRLVVRGRNAGHANSFAISEIISGFQRRHQRGADSQRAGSDCIFRRGDGGVGAGISAGGKLGQSRARCAGRFNFHDGAPRSARCAPANAIFRAQSRIKLLRTSRYGICSPGRFVSPGGFRGQLSPAPPNALIDLRSRENTLLAISISITVT